jgi:hypothetical protein
VNHPSVGVHLGNLGRAKTISTQMTQIGNGNAADKAKKPQETVCGIAVQVCVVCAEFFFPVNSRWLGAGAKTLGLGAQPGPLGGTKTTSTQTTQTLNNNAAENNLGKVCGIVVSSPRDLR